METQERLIISNSISSAHPNIRFENEQKCCAILREGSPSGVSLSWPLVLAGSARPSMTNISGSAACGGRKFLALRSCSCFERIWKMISRLGILCVGVRENAYESVRCVINTVSIAPWGFLVFHSTSTDFLSSQNCQLLGKKTFANLNLLTVIKMTKGVDW